jgi:hypothetical protein
MMYRVIAITCAGLLLAACESGSDWKAPDWFKTPDFSNSFKFGEPAAETVRFESEPPGAEAKASNGQSCRTPCALALPASAETTISFTLAGYQPDTEKLDLVAMGDGTSQLRPNPVLVELVPAAPPAPVRKKKQVKKKQVSSRQPPRAPATASAPAPMAQQPQQAPSSPWPSAQPQR